MSNLVGIILAAGKGTRMKSRLPKALHELCGKPMTRHVIDACKDAGVDECVVVVGHGADEVKAGLGSDVRYVAQEDQRGTGDACIKAMAAVDGDKAVLVLPGDAPLIEAETLTGLCEKMVSSGAEAVILTARVKDPGSYGRIVRECDGGPVVKIVEAKDATADEKIVDEVNSGIYCFRAASLRKYLGMITDDNAQRELYLTDVFGLMRSDGLKIEAQEVSDYRCALGINDRVQLEYMTRIMRKSILRQLMLDGVTVIDRSSTYVDCGVKIGTDTVIHPQTTIGKGCVIGSGCSVGPCTRLSGMTVGDGVSILMSNMADSVVGDGARVGPFANIRPGCEIGRNVKIGDFVELKKAVVKDSASIGHLAYIGDAEVGAKTNIGAGAITCNYDGFKKHRTKIGDNAFVGSNVTMVAPVEIGDGSLVGAGSVITKDVEADALALERGEQTVKEGWAKKRRERMSERK